MRRGLQRTAAALTTLLLVAALAGCGATPVPSGPLGPCGDDAKSMGGYPELERLLPLGLIERSPDKVDSGRSCSDRALGTLATHGIHELRFAGATWEHSGSDATVIAVLATPASEPLLQRAWVEEFYAAGAVAGTKTENVTTTRPTMPGAGEVFRIDTLNDLSLQTVVVWGDRGLVHVVIVATTVNPSASRSAHEERVTIAVDVAASVPVEEAVVPSPA